MGDSKQVMRRPLVGALAIGITAVLLSGCGGGESSDQAELEQARREGAVAAHRADEVRRLEERVSSLEEERADGGVPVESESEATAPEESQEGDARVPASGRYSGQAEQRGTPARLNKDYPMEMTFSSSGSYVSYPTLRCAGMLRPVGFDGSARVYEEAINSGHCDSGGTWLVQVVDSSTLAASWSSSSVSYGVTAVLTSEAP